MQDIFISTLSPQQATEKSTLKRKNVTHYSLINQKFVADLDALISIKQRGFRFGDGIFETCKIFDGIIYDYEAHEARLIMGLKALQISASIVNLKEDSYHLIKKNQIKNGSLRISISRGIGSNGYLPQEKILPLIVIEALEEEKITTPNQRASKEAGIAQTKIIVGISKIKALRKSRIIQKCKTMQGLNYILAKINAKKSGHFDDILLSEDGYISEGSSANVFWVKNNKIFTPSIKCDMLLGTIRKKVLEKFPLKINLVEARPSSLISADEVFLTNANFLVVAVDELIIGSKKVKLQKTISNLVLQWLEEDIKKYCNNQNLIRRK